MGSRMARNKETSIDYWRGIFCFRVRGWGLWFARYKDLRPFFSERNGYQKVWRIGNWARVVLLKPGEGER